MGEDKNGLSGLENIGYTLDKLQEIDGQNEVLHFEKQELYHELQE
jgi:hypothetical protein